MTQKQNLVLLPGLMCTEAIWTPVIDCLTLPMTMHALMHAPLDSMTELADDALRRSPERFALVAHSFGGYVALEMMRRAPERISRLILVASSARADSGDQRVRREQMIRAAKTGKYHSIQKRIMPSLVEPRLLDDPVFCEQLSSMAASVGPVTFLAHLTAAIGRSDSYDLLSQVRCPTLIVCGKQDRVTVPEEQEAMAASTPNAVLKFIDDCGHMTPLEQPSVLAAAISTHLSSNA